MLHLLMVSYRRTLHRRQRAVLRPVLRQRPRRALYRRHSRRVRSLTAVRVDWFGVATRHLQVLLDCYYRLFPEDSPKVQQEREAVRKKQQEALARQREYCERSLANLKRIYGGEK